MKRSFTLLMLFLGFTFFTSSLFAQTDPYKRYNQLSIELSGGLNVPVMTKGTLSRSDYMSVGQFQLGMRYMFNPKFGLKGHYAYNSFSRSGDQYPTIDYHRFVLEGVVNLFQLFNANYRLRENFAILFHGGAGLSFADYSTESDGAKYGNLMAGFTGEFRLTDRLALLGDVSFIGNLQSERLTAYAGEIRGYANVSIGLVYSLGRQERHADWY